MLEAHINIKRHPPLLGRMLVEPARHSQAKLDKSHDGNEKGIAAKSCYQHPMSIPHMLVYNVM